MKKLIYLLAVSGIFLAAPSCKDRQDNDGKTVIVQDSLRSVLPTWQALKIVVSDDRSDMKIVVGDATFYNAPAAEKATKAAELGRMVLRIYGKDSYLEKGTLIVTKDVRNTAEAPADGIATPIDFSTLKKDGK